MGKKKKRIHLPMQGTWVQSLVQKLRFYLRWGNYRTHMRQSPHIATREMPESPN